MRHLAAALAILIALCTAACGVPVAPGYKIVKESRDVRYVPGPPAALAIRSRFTLRNSGASELHFVDVTFPAKRNYGRENLRVEVNGHAVVPQPVPKEYRGDELNTLRIPLNPAWRRGQKRELSVEYMLRSPANSGADITIGEGNFHLGWSGWAPQPQPPNHLLSPYPARPRKMQYTVGVPAGFVVLARGKRKSRKKRRGGIEYRFALRKGDLAPFVVAGRYVTWPRKSRRHSAVFWTLKPLNENPAPAAKEIAGDWRILAKDFGSLGKNLAPHIVESPELNGYIPDAEGRAAAVAFPGGALVNPAALALGVNSGPFLDLVSHALAHNWFGEEIYPSRDAALGLGEGLPEYATIVIDEARKGSAGRRQRIEKFLRKYNAALKNGSETPLGDTMLNSPAAQRQIALAKAPLFFVAIENKCGEAPTRTGLRQLLRILRGKEVGYDDLRAALEDATHKDLAKLFREWLYHKGIPAGFLKRYEAGEAGTSSVK